MTSSSSAYAQEAYSGFSDRFRSQPSQNDEDQQRQHQRRIVRGISNMRNYQLPPTQDAVNSLERVKTSTTHQQIESQLSPSGKQVLRDFDNVLTKGQKFMAEKNRDDQLQQMILHAKKATDLSNREALKSMKGKGG